MESGSLEDAPEYDDWVNPATLSDEQNEEICAGLEALFALPIDPDKRDYPHELSELIRNVFGKERLAFVLNAGDGSILTAFDPAFSFGIEPQEGKSRRRQGRYQSIVGDLRRLSGLFEPLSTELGDTIVLLRPDGKLDDIREFLNANLEEKTYVVYVAPADMEHQTEFPGVYAIIETDAHKIYFANDPDRLKTFPEGVKGHDVVTRKATLDTLDLLGPWIEEQRNLHCEHNYGRYGDTRYAKRFAEDWKAIHREFGRRFIRKDKTYDIELIASTILSYEPTEWTKRAISNNSNVGDLNARIHKRNVNYFAQNGGLWRELLIMEDEGILLIDPLVKEAVSPIIEDAERITTPLRPLKTQERLGYLHRQSKIKCILADEEKELRADKWYSVELRQQEYAKHFSKTENVKGVLQLVRKKRRYYHQRIVIAGVHSFYDDDAENIKYLLKHFDLPEVEDIRTRYPALIAAEDARIEAIQEKYLRPRNFGLKAYQAKDIAALSVNNRGICAWQQGLGKTIGGILFALNMGEKTGKPERTPNLIICPQDLIPQWQREAKEKFGIELHWIGRHKGNGKGNSKIEVSIGEDSHNITGGAIQNLIEARQIAKQIREGAGGWYITHFEALTSGGAKNLRKIEEPYVIRIEKSEVWVEGRYHTDPDTGHRSWIDGQWQTKEKEITTAQECPECGSPLYGGLFCNKLRFHHENDPKPKRCGWTRYIYRLPTIGQVLSTAFKRGVIIVDEGTQIASARNSNEKDSSQKTKAVCGMRSSHRLVMSGTPVKNFIAQAYWLLWWGIGNKSERFNYAYSGGKAEFAKDYTVMEWSYNDDTGNWSSVKEVGEVTNHTKLWAQLASVLLRRIKEETGELIVQKKHHVLFAPLGYYQREQMDYWLQHFPDLFAEKYPNDPKVKRGTHVGMAAILGLDHKLNYASVLPRTDPDWEWTNVNVSNHTPAAFKALTTIMALVKQGRRVLVGTDVKKATPWLASRLSEKGISSRTMLKSNGSGDTLDPADRSKVVEEFQNGTMAVLCSTQKAIRLGHNLDQGTAVVLLGLDWDYETYAQFTERVHRLTSINPIDVYVVIPGEQNLSLVGRKWDVISDKAKGAGMAIDGHIPEQNEEPPDIATIVKEMVEKGLPATGNEIIESTVAAAWNKIPDIEAFEIPKDFADDQAKPWIIDWDAANAAYEVRLATEAAYAAEEAEIAALEDEAMWTLLQNIVVKAVCTALEVFFIKSTKPLPVVEIVAPATNSLDLPVDPETATTVVVDETDPPTDTSDGLIAEPASAPEGQLSFIAPEGGQEPVKSGSNTAPAPSLDYMGQLKQAKELLDLDVLTQDEFNELKASLLAALKAAA